MAKNNNSSINIIDTFCSISEYLAHSGENCVQRLETLPECELRNQAKEAKPEEAEGWSCFLKDFLALADFLHITPQECIVFVALYSEQIEQHEDVDWKDICNFLSINPLRHLPLRKKMEDMTKKGVLNCQNKNGSVSFRSYVASVEVENALLENRPYKQKKPILLDRYRFCRLVSEYVVDGSLFEPAQSELFQNIEKLEKASKHLPLVNELKKMQFSIDDRIIFYTMCDDFIRGTKRRTHIYSCLTDIYEQVTDTMKAMRSFLDKTHPLQTNGLVELCGGDFTQDAFSQLTSKGRALLLEKDFDLFSIGEKKSKDLIRPDSIQEKRLFFKEEMNQQLGKLRTTLMEEQLSFLQQRMAEHAMPKAMTMLFYGAPGTGKTEAVMQLAKATGRSVFHVDISACKSKWFGESEKIMKDIFNQYRTICKQETLKPILLFNEADALFYKRKDASVSSVAQTENTIQNILLEELERFDGILVATTNLATNFDDAFARRFLFKILFDKPTKEAKVAIWKDKLPWLKDDDAQLLAKDHNLSGGEIDNVVRKAMMEEVLKGSQPTVDELSQWCNEEKIDGGNAPTIGFVA